jgi:hypothetical protein
MQLSTHRIRRQCWLCQAGSAEEAFALRRALREAQEVAVPAVFERAFDAAVRGDEVIRLPRLELRVRLAEGAGLAAALPELLDRALREQLAELLKPEVRAKGTGPVADSATRRSIRESRRDGLITYLRTGSLPWELAREDAAALLEEWRETVLANLAEILPQAPDVRTPLPQRITFFFRQLQLLPEEHWAEIARYLSRWLPAAQAEALGRALAALAVWSGGAPASRPPEARRRLAAVALGLAGRGPDHESTGEPEVAALAEVLRIAPGDLLVHLGSLPGDIAAFIAPWLEAASKTARAAGETASASASTLSPASVLPSAQPEEDAAPLAVRSAGLVLLHPYLPRLFESVGLLRAAEPGFSWATLPRAAALLHWLATGREEVLEFELGFIKVLLGRRPEEPLFVDGGLLTAADREEGEALLQAVLGHWRALKNTTPAGLRASFLQRGGLLRGEEKRWRLQVETAAFDLLLDQLPWRLGVVKLPWMTQPIFTEWPTP